MSNNNIKQQGPDTIDLKVISAKLRKRKKLFLITLPIVFVLSCFYIVSIPRYYTTDAKLAPEMENSLSGGTLGSIASSLGFGSALGESTDAISPILYPDLLEDNQFVADLFNIKISSLDGEIKDITYHDYLKNHQDYPWWVYTFRSIAKWFPQKEENKNDKFVPKDSSPYHLTRKEDELQDIARNNIKINLNEKTGVISISVKSQDPLVSKLLADSITSRLQSYITEYRTSKARIDYEYYKKLTEEAKENYEKVRRLYGKVSDANTDVTLKSVSLQLDDIENDMQLKFNTYTALSTQLEAATAKVQERTPAFTIIKGASVPVRPSGPKRMLFVLFMVIIATLVCTIIVIHQDIRKVIVIGG